MTQLRTVPARYSEGLLFRKFIVQICATVLTRVMVSLRVRFRVSENSRLSE